MRRKRQSAASTPTKECLFMRDLLESLRKVYGYGLRICAVKARGSGEDGSGHHPLCLETLVGGSQAREPGRGTPGLELQVIGGNAALHERAPPIKPRQDTTAEGANQELGEGALGMGRGVGAGDAVRGRARAPLKSFARGQGKGPAAVPARGPRRRCSYIDTICTAAVRLETP